MRAAAEEIAARIAELPGVSEAHFIGTQEFEDSDILYCVRVYAPPAGRMQTRRDSLGAVQDVLAEKGIDIPFPQLDVHTK